jgi:hypothetical protein
MTNVQNAYLFTTRDKINLYRDQSGVQHNFTLSNIIGEILRFTPVCRSITVILSKNIILNDT